MAQTTREEPTKKLGKFPSNIPITLYSGHTLMLKSIKTSIYSMMNIMMINDNDEIIAPKYFDNELSQKA